MTPTVQIRLAVGADRGPIEALLAPEVSTGALLPRVVDPTEFWVAECAHRGLVGAVGIQWWSHEVAELGSLVACARGEGIGRALVEAVVHHAAVSGARTVVALTALPDWFARCGFLVQPMAPWALARQSPVLLPETELHLESAVGEKAHKSCARCPRLSTCQQRLMARAVGARARRVA